LRGNDASDTYNGGGGNDWLTEFPSSDLGNDVMNGGGSFDWLDASNGNDILRGQEGDENDRGAFFPSMFGGQGDDELYGGPGEDGMEGEQGTDEHYGGTDNDYIDAVVDDELGTQDLVDCGSGYDTAVVREPEDIVRGNCEEVTDVNAVAAAPGTTTDQEQQQQAAEAFLQENGLQP
jgi:Ca2+-binding RTX toxin-like protein